MLKKTCKCPLVIQRKWGTSSPDCSAVSKILLGWFIEELLVEFLFLSSCLGLLIQRSSSSSFQDELPPESLIAAGIRVMKAQEQPLEVVRRHLALDYASSSLFDRPLHFLCVLGTYPGVSDSMMTVLVVVVAVATEYRQMRRHVGLQNAADNKENDSSNAVLLHLWVNYSSIRK